MGSNRSTWGAIRTSGNTFSWWVWSLTGCPGRLWSLHPWRLKSHLDMVLDNLLQFLEARFLNKEVGSDDPQRSLPMPTILWLILWLLDQGCWHLVIQRPKGIEQNLLPSLSFGNVAFGVSSWLCATFKKLTVPSAQNGERTVLILDGVAFECAGGKERFPLPGGSMKIPGSRMNTSKWLVVWTLGMYTSQQFVTKTLSAGACKSWFLIFCVVFSSQRMNYLLSWSHTKSCLLFGHYSHWNKIDD